MITLATTASLSPSLKPPNLTSPLIKLEPSFFHHHCKTLIKVKQNKTLKILFFFYSPLNFFLLLLIQRKKFNRGICRAALSDDTPFAVAISVCMLSSLLLPNTATKDEEEESDSGITTTDTRIAVMGIISFIPYFNWLVSVLVCVWFLKFLYLLCFWNLGLDKVLIFCCFVGRVGFLLGLILGKGDMLFILLFTWPLIWGFFPLLFYSTMLTLSLFILIF